jgi:inosine-uridine nucleoside N-ribohydrolase
MNKKKIIIDTDFGTDVDDALAISLSLCCNDLIEIIAITIVGRQVFLKNK